MPEVPRRSLLGLAAWACAAPLRAQGEAARILPAIGLDASDGEPVLAALPKARLTYIDFWASWCAPCRLSFPWLDRMHERHASQGLRIVAVGLDRREPDALRFLQQTQPRFATALDPAAASANALDLQAMPSSFLVDAGRRLRWVHRGFREDDRAALEARLRNALG